MCLCGSGKEDMRYKGCVCSEICIKKSYRFVCLCVCVCVCVHVCVGECV